MLETAQILREFAVRSCSGSEDFLNRAWASAENPSSMAFRAAYASIARRLGARSNEQVAPPTELASRARPHWNLTDWIRLALVLAALSKSDAKEHASMVLKLFEAGEIGEQESVLRTLPLLPDPERFIDTGLQACRTNARRVFEAIACENPYPAAHFPELNFNQMVLKAIFMEVPVQRIEKLNDRITPELQRMARDYASERRAAGRVVPEDTDFIAKAGTR